MADTNHVRRDDYVEFSENDPFAELTRIMGHDPRVSEPAPQAAAAPVSPAAAHPATDDFAIDLESELAGDFDFSDFDGRADDQAGDHAGHHAPVADWRQETVAYEEASPEDAFDDFFAGDLAPEPAQMAATVLASVPEPVDARADEAYAPIDLVDDLAGEIDAAFEREFHTGEFHAGETDAVAPEPETAMASQPRWDDYDARAEETYQPAREVTDLAVTDLAVTGADEAEEDWTTDAEFDLQFLEQELEASAAQSAMKVMPRAFEAAEPAAPYHDAPEARAEPSLAHSPAMPEEPSAPQNLSLEEELGLLLADDPVPPAAVAAKPAPSPLGNFGRANFASAAPSYVQSGTREQETVGAPVAVSHETDWQASAPVDASAGRPAEGQDDLSDLLGDEFDFDLNLDSEPATRAAPILPDIETVEVSEAVQPVVDDLDIPEISYDTAPAAPAGPFDDFEAEFADVFGDIARSEPSPAAASAATAAAAAVAARPAPAPDMQPYVLDDAQWQAAQDFPESDLGYESDLEKEISSSIYDDDEARPAPRRRGVLVAAAIAGIAVLGGLGVFGMSMFGGGSDAPALVKADTDPMKVRPENPGGTTVPNQNSEVYQRVAGGAPDAAPAQETLITSVEEPVDVAARTAPAQEPAMLAPGIDDGTDIGADIGQVKSEDRIEPESASSLAAEETAMVTPRRVRTMVVRPDGTMVPREEIEPAPAAEPAIAEQPLAAAPLQPAEADDGPTVDTPQTVAVVPTQRVEPQTPARPAAPAPQPAAQRPAAPAPAPAAAPVAAAPAGATSEWSMQVASQPTAEGAQSTYQDLARRYGSVLEGRGVNIVRADIEGRGTYYRVRIPASSRDEAIQLCTRYKAAGGSCFVSR